MKNLFDVQVHHADVLMDALENYGGALDGSITGAGKTVVAAEIAHQSDRPTFVVCPKSGIPMWHRELADRNVKVHGVINYEMLRTGNTPFGDWDGQMWDWRLPEDSLVIWDECQKLQGMNTQNARMGWSAKPFYNLLLSATAAEDPTEMKASGFLLSLHDLKGFWNWTKMHGCQNGTWGGLVFSGMDEDIDRLHHIVFPRHGSRLTYKDMAPYFKETAIVMEPLDFGDNMKAVYTQMQSELSALESRTENDSPDNALTIRLRARQKAELLKVPEIIERTHALLKEGLSVAIFVNFDATAVALREKITVPTGMITGYYLKERQRFLDDFQADVLRVMICNVQAGGILVNLHDTHGKHPRVSLISPSDNAKDVIQCLGRIHRAGGATPTRQYVLFAAGTIEEEVHANCVEKMRRIDIFNQGIQ
jgi:SNF2 family DNA or RNA helicase